MPWKLVKSAYQELRNGKKVCICLSADSRLSRQSSYLKCDSAGEGGLVGAASTSVGDLDGVVAWLLIDVGDWLRGGETALEGGCLTIPPLNA